MNISHLSRDEMLSAIKVFPLLSDYVNEFLMMVNHKGYLDGCIMFDETNGKIEFHSVYTDNCNDKVYDDFSFTVEEFFNIQSMINIYRKKKEEERKKQLEEMEANKKKWKDAQEARKRILDSLSPADRAIMEGRA
jgi:hypothetical protein